MGELWRTLTKPSRGLPPTRWVGESGVGQLGMLRPRAPAAAHQGVVFGVGDFGLVEHVVQVLVAAQLFAKRFDFAGGIFHRPLNYNLTRNRENIPITAYKNAVLIYNPRAGKFGRKGAALLDRAASILRKPGRQVTLAPTTGPRTAGAIAREHIGRGADLVIVAPAATAPSTRRPRA